MCATGVQVSPQQDFKLERRFPMKKFLSFVAIALLVMGLATSVVAVEEGHDTKYTIINAGASSIVSVVPSSIIGNDGTYQLLAVDVGQNLAASTTGEAIVALYDSSSLSTMRTGNLECELESNDSDTVTKTWVRPLRISNGLVVQQGAYSIVTIEYQRAGR